MMNTKRDFINPEELNVINIFDNVEYIIPIYQRNYAWGVKEIEQLLNDIFDCNSNSNQNYYLGNLIVDKDNNKSNTYYVIDGQQRLNTLFLLFKYLYENDNSDKWNLIQNSLKFEARDKSNRTLIEDFEELLKYNNLDTFSTELINGYKIIKNYFESRIINCKNFIEEIRNIKKLFLERLKNIKIIRTQVPEKIDLNYYFEVMNTRGEQLELHEIAKSKIIEQLRSNEDRLIAAKIWDACSQMDTYVQMNFNPDIRNCLFDKKWDKFRFYDFEKLNNLFKNTDENKNKYDIKSILDATNFHTTNKNTNQTESERLKSIFEELNKQLNNNIHDSKEKEENKRFESIISFPNFLLIVNEVLKKEEDDNDSSLDDKNLLDNLATYWSNKEKAKLFILSLLKYRFLFDKYIIKREFAKNYKDTGKWSLQKLENNDNSPNYSSTFSNQDDNQRIRALQSVFRITYTSPKTMHWISKVLSKIDINEDKDEILGNKIINILENYACNKIDRTNYKLSSGFGFSRIIFTYLDYLLIRDGFKDYLKSVNFGNFEFQFRNSIEHFSPQTGGDFSDKYDVLNSFGNLALITVSGNSKFSNMTPNQKIDNKNESIVKQSPKLMIMAELTKINSGKWNEDMVSKHGNEMFGILEKAINKG